MAWMARDPQMRTDPRKLFSEARSVVVVALNYYTPEIHSADPKLAKFPVMPGATTITMLSAANCERCFPGFNYRRQRRPEKSVWTFSR
jgi:epoxyqueuosine reductase QueG